MVPPGSPCQGRHASAAISGVRKAATESSRFRHLQTEASGGVDPHPRLQPHQGLSSLPWALLSVLLSSLTPSRPLSPHPWSCLTPEPVHTFLCFLTVLGARLSSLGWLWGPLSSAVWPPPTMLRPLLTFSPLLSHPFPPHQNHEPTLRPCSHDISRDLDSFTPSHWLFIQQLFTEHLPCAGSRVRLGVPSACVHSWVEWKTEGAVAHDQPLQLVVCG